MEAVSTVKHGSIATVSAGVFANVVATVILLFTFQVLTPTPLYTIIVPLEQVYTIIMACFAVLFYADRLIRFRSLNAFEILLPVFVILIPLYTAVVANLYWGQPVINGLTSQKFWFISLGVLVLYYMLTARLISLKQLHNLILALAWTQLGVYLLAEVLLDPARYHGSTFVYCNEAKGGCGFKFNVQFIAYAALFYFLKSVKQQRLVLLLPVLVMCFYLLLFHQKRGLMLILLGICALIMFVHGKPKQWLQYALIAFGIIVIGLVGLQLIAPQKLSALSTQYVNFFDVVQGEETGEASADSRLRELVTLNDFVNRHPSSVVWGNGKWSDNWKENPALAARFYPSDLGFLGSLFVYGLVGILLVHLQFVWIIKWARRALTTERNILFLHVLWFIAFFYVRSIPTGGIFFAYGPAAILFGMMLVYHVYQNRESHAF